MPCGDVHSPLVVGAACETGQIRHLTCMWQDGSQLQAHDFKGIYVPN